MSFGTKTGRALGTIGALAVHGVVRGATGLGSFGSDLVAGADVAYTEKSAALDAAWTAKLAQRKLDRDAALAAHKLAMQTEPTSAPVVTKRGRVAL